MEAKIMDVLNIKEQEQKLFGVKIQVTRSRSIFLMKGSSVETFETEIEANERVGQVNKMLSEKPELEQKFKDNPTVKVFTMN